MEAPTFLFPICLPVTQPRPAREKTEPQTLLSLSSSVRVSSFSCSQLCRLSPPSGSGTRAQATRKRRSHSQSLPALLPQPYSVPNLVSVSGFASSGDSQTLFT